MYYGRCDLKESDLTSVNLHTFESNGRHCSMDFIDINVEHNTALVRNK